jgi:hypothetical protein
MFHPLCATWKGGRRFWAVRVRLLGCAAAACIAVAQPAGAGPTPEEIVAAHDVPTSMAVDRTGRAFLVTAARVRSAAPGRRFGPSRTVVRPKRGDRVAGAGVGVDGRGVVFVQSADRKVRAVPFGSRMRAPVTVSEGVADFATAAVAPSGAAVVVWFRHREDHRWRLEAAVRERGAAAFGPPEPLSGFVRRACCTNVSAAIGARGDAVVTWRSTVRASVWAALRRPAQRFHRAHRLAGSAADEPKAFVGAGGAAAVIYSTEHVPRATADGLQLRRATSGAGFGPAEHVNPGGGVTIADASITPAGDVSIAWVDQVHGPRVHLSEAPAGGPLSLTAALGTNAARRPIAVATDEGGRAVVAWAESSVRRERVVAATRPVRGAPFGAPVACGRRWRAAEPRLVRLVPGGALVLWKASRYGPPAARRTALAVTRLA